jgi:hypothetical protein
MNAYESKFHDGFVDGFLIREWQVIIFGQVVHRPVNIHIQVVPNSVDSFLCKPGRVM